MGEERLPLWPLCLSSLFGSLYLLVGVLDVLSQIGLIAVPFTTGDLIASLMLLIVGSVFITGTPLLHKGEREGYAFTLVATTLAGILFLLQLFVFASNGLGWILGFEDWIEWTPISDITPSIWLFSLILLTMGILRGFKMLGGEKGIFPIGGR